MSRKVNAIDRFTGKPAHENAIFHQFGLEATETGGSFSCAIIELSDGRVVTWDVNHIQFVKDEVNA